MKDKDGRALDGAGNYRLNVPANAPFQFARLSPAAKGGIQNRCDKFPATSVNSC